MNRASLEFDLTFILNSYIKLKHGFLLNLLNFFHLFIKKSFIFLNINAHGFQLHHY